MVCGTLVPWPGPEPAPSALAAWSLNHWTSREVPCAQVLNPPAFPAQAAEGLFWPCFPSLHASVCFFSFEFVYNLTWSGHFWHSLSTLPFFFPSTPVRTEAWAPPDLRLLITLTQKPKVLPKSCWAPNTALSCTLFPLTKGILRSSGILWKAHWVFVLQRFLFCIIYLFPIFFPKLIYSLVFRFWWVSGLNWFFWGVGHIFMFPPPSISLSHVPLLPIQYGGRGMQVGDQKMSKCSELAYISLL